MNPLEREGETKAALKLYGTTFQDELVKSVSSELRARGVFGLTPGLEWNWGSRSRTCAALPHTRLSFVVKSGARSVRSQVSAPAGHNVTKMLRRDCPSKSKESFSF